jgi:hypothetical protein
MSKPCQCNVCRLQRGEITVQQALKRELKEKRQLERLLVKGKGDLWAIECNLDFSNMFIEDLQKKLKEQKVG